MQSTIAWEIFQVTKFQENYLLPQLEENYLRDRQRRLLPGVSSSSEGPTVGPRVSSLLSRVDIIQIRSRFNKIQEITESSRKKQSSGQYRMPATPNLNDIVNMPQHFYHVHTK